jgi:hypothetical protein
VIYGQLQVKVVNQRPSLAAVCPARLPRRRHRERVVRVHRRLLLEPPSGRGYRRRIVYLDEVTAALASQQTAADASPVGPTMIWHMFEPLGVSPARLRQDRILDETRHTRHTADPVHLVRVFGITESTAINYVHAAHPER